MLCASYCYIMSHVAEMAGEKIPYLRYPLWRLTAVLIAASTALSGTIFVYLRRQENIRRKKWEEFFK